MTGPSACVHCLRVRLLLVCEQITAADGHVRPLGGDRGTGGDGSGELRSASLTVIVAAKGLYKGKNQCTPRQIVNTSMHRSADRQNTIKND